MLKMELYLKAIIAILLVSCSSCRNSYFTSTLQPTAFYNCVKGLAKQIGILLEQYNNGFNSSSVQNVINAKNGGFTVEGLFIPCRSKSVQQQVDIIFKAFGFHTIERYWLYPASTYESECDWTNYEAQENCQYLKNLIAQMKSRGLLNVEIAAQREDWTQVFDTETGCPDVSQSLLWWIPTGKQDDGKPNFNNYEQIGGWEKPYMKPYSSGKICGGVLNVNYYQ